MKKFSNILWGIALIALGCVLGLNALKITDIDIFFDGWWTLFIIVPCFIGLFREREKTGNLIGILIGIALLLCCQDILTFEMMWRLLLPVILILIGFSLLFKKKIDQKIAKEIQNLNVSQNVSNDYYAIFSGQKANYANETFKGATITALFGGADIDLRQAVFEEDQVIQCVAIFGGIDIYVPDNINVKIKSTSIFGGVGNKRKSYADNSAVTLYVNATCIFGGVDVK